MARHGVVLRYPQLALEPEAALGFTVPASGLAGTPPPQVAGMPACQRARTPTRQLAGRSGRQSDCMLLSDSHLLLPIPQGWATPIRQWELHLRSQGQRPATVDTRIRHVRRLARDIDAGSPDAVEEDDLTAWSGLQQWAPETRHSHHASIRLFFRWWCGRTGAPSPGEVLGGIRRHVPPPRPTPEDILRAAIREAAPRTRLILQLAAELGLRRSEIASLHRRDLVHAPDGWTLTVQGKGGRTRVLPVTDSLARDIQQAGQTWIFPGQIDGHLSARWVSKLAARVLPPGWTLHSLRHRFATTAYRQGGHDILGVQQALGHGSVQTTQRYTAGTPSAIRAMTASAALTTTSINHHRKATTMRISICNVKGGTGKTTSAIMLAAAAHAAGYSTRVLDADPQGSASDWAALAEDSGRPLEFEVVAVNARSLTRTTGAPVEFEFVDCPPGMPSVINAAINTADAVIVPTCPSGIEVARMWETLDLVDHSPAAVLLTSVQLGTRTLRDTQEALADQQVAVFTNVIPQRQQIKMAWGTNPSWPWHGYDGVIDELKEQLQ